MVSHLAHSVRSIVRSLMGWERSMKLQSGKLSSTSVSKATRKTSLITLQDIKTSVVPAQPTLEAIYEFVNENGWVEDIIPILKLGITKILSDTETTIAEFEEDIALYFQKFWYNGDGSFESIKLYPQSHKLPIQKEKIILESLLHIDAIFESLKFSRKYRLPKILKETRWHIQNLVLSKEKDEAFMKNIREILVTIANDRVSLEQFQKDFATQTSTERWFGNIQS